MRSTTFERLDDLRAPRHDLDAAEAVQIAIRPFSFCAGNQPSLAVYPETPGEEFESLSKPPRLTMIMSINDWVQTAPSSIDPIRYPYNIRPQHFNFISTAGPDDGSNVVTGAVGQSTLPFSRQGKFVAASHFEPNGDRRADHAGAYLQGGDNE